MIESWITRIGIGLGILLALVYVVIALLGKRRPELPVAMTCVITGGGLVVGPVLIYSAFDSDVAKQSLKPEHLAIAGLAMLWVSVQFCWSLKGSSGSRSETLQADQTKGQAPCLSEGEGTGNANIPTLPAASETEMAESKG